MDDDLVGGGDLDGDALDLLHDHLVGIPQVHDQLVALFGHTVAHAVDIQLLLEAVGHAHHHVVQQRAGQAVEGPVLLGVVGAGDMEHALLHGDGHAGLELPGQGALGALDSDDVVVL